MRYGQTVECWQSDRPGVGTDIQHGDRPVELFHDSGDGVKTTACQSFFAVAVLLLLGEGSVVVAVTSENGYDQDEVEQQQDEPHAPTRQFGVLGIHGAGCVRIFEASCAGCSGVGGGGTKIECGRRVSKDRAGLGGGICRLLV